ncbi:MAG: energy transducer TonB [Terriglobia bacterium]
MKRLLLAMVVLGNALTLAAQTDTSKEKSAYQSAETLSVTDISVPVSGNGTVVLNALIVESGKPKKVEVRRDIPVLTPLAMQAVEDWKFSPATLSGKAIASRMPIAVTFRPPGYATPVPLPALIPQSEEAIQAAFQPAEVTRAAFPRYPDTTVVAGAVVLEVTLSEKGGVDEVKVLRDLPPLTEEAKTALADFRFMAAAFNGSPVRSKIVLAFVSQPFSNSPSASRGFGGNCSRARGR